MNGAGIGADAGTTLTLSNATAVTGPGDLTKFGPGTVVLLKASRGAALERVLAGIEKER